MSYWIRHILLPAIILSMIACLPPSIQTLHTEVASSYSDPEGLYFDASRKGNILTVMRLVEEKIVDVETRDRYGWTGCMYAARIGHEGLLEYFLSKKIDIDLKENKGQTALMVAVNARNYDIVKLLIDAGANVTSQDQYGYTALMWAINDRSWDSIPLLLATMKGINIQNYEGDTALHMAIDYRSYDDIVFFLVEKGADMILKNRAGKTALDIAKEKNYVKIVDLLESKMNKK
jgi:ankyrin repeat protein